MNEMTIQTTGLCRRFGNLTAVNQVDLHVPSGSVYGFLGPNGAGKTTTIRMLLGLIRPSAGSVQVFGRPLSIERQAILRRVGSLVEAPSIYPHLTGRENLEVVARMIDATRTQIDRALTIVRLERDASRLAREYSQGMRQRLGLALALLPNPDLLVLDEPTNGLDPAGIHEIRQLICELPLVRGVTVFVSSHLLSEVEQMATHIGIIDKGKMIFQGTPEQLRARYQEHLAIGTERLEDAQRILAGAGWRVSYDGNHHLTVQVNGTSDAAMINAQLVGAGIQVYGLNIAQPSLEDIFLTLTQ